MYHTQKHIVHISATIASCLFACVHFSIREKQSALWQYTRSLEKIIIPRQVTNILNAKCIP